MASRYHDVYGAWQANPEAFWAEAAREIDWIKPPRKSSIANAGVYGRWFPDATCNTCYNALDRHVDGGRGEQAALIYDSPVTGAKRTYTYGETARRGRDARRRAAGSRRRARATASSSTCR